MSRKPIVALIYDFDGTLSPGNMQEYGFFPAIDKSAEEFWQKSDDLAKEQDASNILSYMKLMITEGRKRGMSLRREDFRKFGSEVELFEGVVDWFGLINDYGKSKGLTIEHYIISSGLVEMIEGTPIAKEFKRIFGCSFIYNASGEASWPAVAVDYTAKTQFLFKINKGIFSVQDNKEVNESQLEETKRIPFPHMIYFGDGETDVPCMKIVKMFGGHSIGIYDPMSNDKKKVAKKLLKQERVNFITPSIYTKESRTYKIVCSIIDKIKVENQLRILSRKK